MYANSSAATMVDFEFLRPTERIARRVPAGLSNTSLMNCCCQSISTIF
jgi:hypothetical protein